MPSPRLVPLAPPAGAEGPRPALAHLAIDAASLPAAIITAVRHIERVGIAVTSVQPADLVSLKDIATRSGRSYESVRKRGVGQPASLYEGSAQWKRTGQKFSCPAQRRRPGRR